MSTLLATDTAAVPFHPHRDSGQRRRHNWIADKVRPYYDLSILTKTDLPAIIHDSFLLTDIGDIPTGKIVKQYLEIAKLGKQVFIALDKTESYGPETGKDLNDNQVLYLSEGGNELFGWSWDKKAGSDT